MNHVHTTSVTVLSKNTVCSTSTARVMKKLLLALTVLVFLFGAGTHTYAQQGTGDDICDSFEVGSKDWQQAGCGGFYSIENPRVPVEPEPQPVDTTGGGGVYDDICDSFTPNTKDWYAAGCAGFYPTVDPTTSGPSTIPGTIGGPSVTPINSTVALPGNTALGGGSQSSASELSQCSKIKFMSLLDILIWIKCIIVVAIIPLIFALALLFFLWGVMKFIGASDSTKKEEGKKFIIAGIIGLFVMTSLWGIIKILGTTLGIESTVPALQTKSTTLPLPTP
ncbi:MAG: hypothetical protein KBD54_02650 [Candidatus Pacebacteria bacterium]|nr:hypothetical protein [Candidatus Paceibacterota bacterium]